MFVLLDEPFFDVGADDVGMILLQVMESGAELDEPAVFESLREVLCEGRGYQSSGIADEEELGIRGLGQSMVCLFHGRVYVGGLSCDGQFIGEAPGGAPRFGSGKWRPVDRQLLLGQLSHGRGGKDAFDERVALENHLFADSGCSKLLEG